MSILNAVSILGAGVGRGYQASQALQREIAEARRKALIEERETSVRERQADTERMLREAQVREADENVLTSRGTREEADRRRRYLQTPVSGSKFNLDLMGNKVSLPPTMETLLDPNMSDLLARLNEEASRTAGGYYKNVGGGGREPTDMELAIRVLDQYMGQPAPLETIQGERRDEALSARREHALGSLPIILKALRDIRSGSARQDTGFTIEDQGDPLGIFPQGFSDRGSRRDLLRDTTNLDLIDREIQRITGRRDSVRR